MWRDDVMFDDEEQVRVQAERRGRDALLSVKTAQMLLFYSVFVACAWLVMSSYDLGSRHQRGLFIIAALWLCHLDAASWRPKLARADGAGARLASGALDFAARSRWLVLALALAPLVSGLMAMPWPPRMGLWAIGSRLIHALFLWLNALGLLASWGSIVSPRELSLLEECAPEQGGRAWIAARRTAWPMVFSAIAWSMFCRGAGWM